MTISPEAYELHFLAGLVIYLLLQHRYGIVAVVLAGAGKEVYDIVFDGDPDTYDFLWTVIGGLVAYFFTQIARYARVHYTSRAE
jgi:hypothetical protein